MSVELEVRVLVTHGRDGDWERAGVGCFKGAGCVLGLDLSTDSTGVCSLSDVLSTCTLMNLISFICA